MSTGDSSSLERNRYFYGKLMTPRDMEAEQVFHRSRLDTLARTVAGVGIVQGLSVTQVRTVRDVGDEEVELEVTVDPGVAIDSDGRILVLSTRERPEYTIPDADVDEVRVYLRYHETETERVPTPDLGQAVGKGCEFNRVVESPEVVCQYEGYEGVERESKPIPEIDLDVSDGVSTSSDGAAEESETGGPVRIAQSYREAADKMQHPDQPGVFLDAFRRIDGEWQTVGEDRRAYVYTNDMLYAALVRHLVEYEGHVADFDAHLADFDNPHNVTGVGGGGLPEGLRERIEELEQTVESLGTTVPTLESRIGDLQSQVEKGEMRTKMLERYVIDRSLEEAIDSFEAVAEEFDSSVARDIADTVHKQASEQPEIEPEEYLEMVMELLDLEEELGRELEGDATESSLGQYMRAVESMKEVLEEERKLDEEDREILRIVLAQDRVNETAGWLFIRLAAFG